jgi:hypothetical protein
MIKKGDSTSTSVLTTTESVGRKQEKYEAMARYCEYTRKICQGTNDLYERTICNQMHDMLREECERARKELDNNPYKERRDP